MQAGWILRALSPLQPCGMRIHLLRSSANCTRIEWPTPPPSIHIHDEAEQARCQFKWAVEDAVGMCGSLCHGLAGTNGDGQF